MVFFEYGLTTEQYKDKFIELTKLYHPDKGGSNNEFILLNEEYKECIILAKHWGNLLEFFNKNAHNEGAMRSEKLFIPSPPSKLMTQVKPFISEEGIKNTAEIFLAGRDIFKEITKSIKEIKKQSKRSK